MMLRIVIILALLVSLFYLVKHIQPVAEPGGAGKVATSRPVTAPVEVTTGEDSNRFNPPVVTPLPDVNKGYVFSEKREYVKTVPLAAGKSAQVEQGPDPLASLLYSGSVIVGNLRRALVSYQEQTREPALRRPTPGRGPAPAVSQGGVRNKQLHQGDSFLGYVVAAIEPDRIVFAKGDLKVEKFLHDRNKKRIAAAEPSRREVAPTEIGGVPLQALAPPEVLGELMALPPSAGSAPGPASTSGVPSEATPGGETGGVTGRALVQRPPNRVTRRSQRLLGIDPSIIVPATPVPGRPGQNK